MGFLDVTDPHATEFKLTLNKKTGDGFATHFQTLALYHLVN